MKKMCLLFLVLMLVPLAHAVAIGVNRASIQFTDVLRGGYAEDSLVVTTDSSENITAQVMVDGEAAPWLNFSDEEFNFSRDHPYTLHISVQPPNDAQIQTYQVNLSVITGSVARTGGGKIGTSVHASFRVPITITMTGIQYLRCTVGGISVDDAEQAEPLPLRMSILNRGNVRVNPDVSVEVFDQYRSRSLGTRSLSFGSSILPTVTQQSAKTVSFDLQPGQYWATVNVPQCGYSGLFTFDVLPPGGIKDDGEFIRIDAKAWANTGDIIPIDAVFRNKGARSVRASFKGTIKRIESGEIVKVIDTEDYIVDPDVTAQIETFFNPVVGGQYEVTGKVFYNNKLTGERSTLINVNGAAVKGSSSFNTPVIIIIVIVILVLLILIRRRRRA